MGSMSFRFSKQMEDELEFIQNELNTTKTEVLKIAIHHLYDQTVTSKKKESLAEYLKKSGIIGAFKAEENLSTDYKSIIEEGWDSKYE